MAGFWFRVADLEQGIGGENDEEKVLLPSTTAAILYLFEMLHESHTKSENRQHIQHCWSPPRTLVH